MKRFPEDVLEKVQAVESVGEAAPVIEAVLNPDSRAKATSSSVWT
ncbi:MAG: hypothetical protein U0Q16_07735 [Bryobacteraceae bacterium]